MSEVPIGDLKIHANGGEAKTVAPQSYTELIINNPRIQSAAQKYKPEALLLVPIPFIQDICNGSSSSWGLYPRNTREATRLLELVHKGDQKELQEHLSFMLTIFEGQIEKYLPHKTIKRFKTHKLDETSSVHLFASGAEGINGAHDLLARGKRFAATFENGTEVLNETHIKLPLRDDQNNILPDKDLLHGWEQAVADGARFLSFTLASKSGRRYDDLGKKVVKMVRDHNRKNPTDQITLVIDAVQMLGRDTPDKVYDWLKDEGVAGVVHTGSKAPGGLAHSGFLWLSEEGLQKLYNSPLSEEEKKQVLEKRGWVNYMTTHAGDIKKSPKRNEHLATMARGVDNIKAIIAQNAYLMDPQYALVLNTNKKSQTVREAYIDMFESEGFALVDKDDPDNRQLPSLLSFTHPDYKYRNSSTTQNEKTEGDERRKIFDDYLYSHGAAPGGYLHDANTFPMFRWGIDWDVVRGLMTGELSEENFKKGLDHLKQIIHEGLEQSRTTYHKNAA